MKHIAVFLFTLGLFTLTGCLITAQQKKGTLAAMSRKILSTVSNFGKTTAGWVMATLGAPTNQPPDLGRRLGDLEMDLHPIPGK